MAAKTRARPSWLKRSEPVGYTHVELFFFFYFVRSPWRWKGEKTASNRRMLCPPASRAGDGANRSFRFLLNWVGVQGRLGFALVESTSRLGSNIWLLQSGQDTVEVCPRFGRFKTELMDSPRRVPPSCELSPSTRAAVCM